MVSDVKVPGMNAKKNDFSYSFLLKNFMRGGRVNDNAWKVSKYGVFSGPYFPGESPYSVRMRENKDQKKLRIWAFFTHC